MIACVVCGVALNARRRGAAVASEGHGGFMHVVVHPGFPQNRLVDFSHAEAGPGGKGVVLARGVVANGEEPVLKKVETPFRASPYVEDDGHFSGRIAFSKDGSNELWAYR